MQKKQTHGFLLVETMVSIALFTMVMVAAISALLMMTAADRKANNSRKVTDNLSFILEDMTRNIRLGTGYHCEESPNSDFTTISNPSDCKDVAGAFLAIRPRDWVNSSSPQIIYRLNNEVIEKSEDSGVTFVALTLPEVRVKKLQFKVYGSGDIDGVQSRVQIFLQAVASEGTREESKINLQTFVTQRTTDL